MVQSAIVARPSARRLWAVRVLTVLAIAGAFVAVGFFHDHLGAFRRYAGSPLGLVLLFALSAASSATLILPVPGLALTSLAGSAASPVVVGVIAGIGQTLGELTGYMAGYSGHTLVAGNARYEGMVGWIRRYGMVTLFALAVVPNPVFDVAGMIAGALRMPVWRFLVSAGAGKVVKNVIFAYLGYLGIEALVRWFP